MNLPKLILITDTTKHDDELCLRVEAVLGTATFRDRVGILLRNPMRRDVRDLARRLRATSGAVGASLVVHSDIELARTVGADGIHFAQADSDAVKRVSGEFRWTSVSTHTDAEVHAAWDAGANAVFVSPIFATPGKGEARGLAAIESAKRTAPDMWVVALGGIDRARFDEVFCAGADAVAMIRAWTEGDALVLANSPNLG